MRKTTEELFWAKVQKGPGLFSCWTWTASTDRGGYGRFRFQGKPRRAHQWAWIDANGPVPEGLGLDHLCRVRHCVRPSHLEPVTHAENMRRGRSGEYWAAKTHCPQGHPYSGANLYTPPGKKCRCCRACKKAAKRRAAIKRTGENHD